MDHVMKTECSNKDCGGSCFVCCCGYCENCGLFEGCLTSECPNVESYKDHGDAVYQGKEDFRHGQWVGKCSYHSPRCQYLGEVAKLLDRQGRNWRQMTCLERLGILEFVETKPEN